MGNEVYKTSTNLLRSRVKRKVQARFWRAAALVRESLTLITIREIMNNLFVKEDMLFRR